MMAATPTIRILTLALDKGDERFVFVFLANQLKNLLRTFDRYASDPELSFTWYDAAYLSRRARRLVFSR